MRSGPNRFREAHNFARVPLVLECLKWSSSSRATVWSVLFCTLESLFQRQIQGARLDGYFLICSLDGSNRLQEGAVSTSLPDQPRQSTERESPAALRSLSSASSRRQCGSSVPRAAMQRGHQFRNDRCNRSCCVPSSSVGSLQGSMTLPAAEFHHVTEFSIRHEVGQLSERTVRVLVPVSSCTHPRQVTDCNDWSVDVCNLETDVDACPLVVEARLFPTIPLEHMPLGKLLHQEVVSWLFLRRAAIIDEQSAFFLVADVTQ